MRLEPVTGAAIQRRRTDLDWLRVIAFFLLIYFHAAVVFLPSGIPMVQNDEPSRILQWLVAFLHEFRLALLFLISGAGVAFALKQRTRDEFFRERSTRLLLPLAFGILAVVPPMVWLEKKFIGDFDGSLTAFYGEYLTQGVYPEGHLSWHHYWFIAYLYLFCLLAWPAFSYLRSPSGRRRLNSFSAWLQKGLRIYCFILPLLAFEIPLRAVFPGFRNLILDWASFFHWFLIFLAGYVFASQRALLDRTQDLRRLSLGLGLVTTGLLFGFFWSPERSGFRPFPDGEISVTSYVLFCLVRMANVWFWLLACLGFAGRHLQRGEPAARYLTGTVYPLFCLHLPVIVALGYWLVPQPLGIWPKYLIITTTTLLLTLSAYELVLRRLGWLGLLLGIKPGARCHGESAAVVSRNRV